MPGGEAGAAAGPVDRISDRARACPHSDLGPKYDPKKLPFNASHSWLIGDLRILAQVLAFAAAALLVLAGIGLWAQAGWWRPTAVVGLGVSTVLILLYFTRWYLFILVVNIALIVGIAFMEWPSKTTVGA
jgi:hypothetical protein